MNLMVIPKQPNSTRVSNRVHSFRVGKAKGDNNGLGSKAANSCFRDDYYVWVVFTHQGHEVTAKMGVYRGPTVLG